LENSVIAILLIAVFFVAFTNGANANFKGVASLYGSGSTSLKHAMYWGTATTLAGSVMALFWAAGLMKKFGGRGIVPDELAQSPDFSTSVAVGASLTTFLATRFGFPISTTHALVGSIIGAGLAGCGWSVQFAVLGKQVVYPLLFSPLVAIALGAAVYGLLHVCRLLPEAESKTLNWLHTQYLVSGDSHCHGRFARFASCRGNAWQEDYRNESTSRLCC
jgi:PiT family inorganic phosphate transporter